MRIVASGCCVRIDGIQFGPQYSKHSTAVHEGMKLKQKQYPHAEFVDMNPEITPEIRPSPQTIQIPTLALKSS